MKYLILLLMCIVLTGCPPNQIPKIDISLWAGDSDREGITRAQDRSTISCQERQFDDYVCLTYDDLRDLYATFLKCSQWETEVSKKNTKKFIDKNMDIHRNLFEKMRRLSKPDASKSKPII